MCQGFIIVNLNTKKRLVETDKGQMQKVIM
jgi:hypothetical protein